jgi:hypothetical protein
MPEEDPTLATEGLLLLHVPPELASKSSVVFPAQTPTAPEIATGIAFTASIAVAVQAPSE